MTALTFSDAIFFACFGHPIMLTAGHGDLVWEPENTREIVSGWLCTGMGRSVGEHTSFYYWTWEVGDLLRAINVVEDQVFRK